ncbi:MAG: prolipoprotein diacylglyceryl transferase [Pseudomonadota bacterium]
MTTLAIPFPVIDPVLLQIGPFAIRWYALAYIAGLVLGWWQLSRLMSRDALWPGNAAPMSKAHLDDFLLWATIGIVLGGRLGYVLFYNPGYYLENPGEALAVWQGGMSFHGGFLGVCAAVFLFARRHAIPMLSLGDAVAVVAPIGLFFGRIANFINAELWGRTTDLPWGVVFPNGGPEPRHPSQLYEAALEGVLLFVILQVLVARGGLKRPGLAIGTFLLGYGVSRMLVELVREPDAQIGYLFGPVTMGMLLSLPMALIGLGLVLSARRTLHPA